MLSLLKKFQITLFSIALSAAWFWASGLFSIANASSVPSTVMQSISAARLLGQSRLVVFGFQIYDAKLWVGDKFSAENYAALPLALELRYLRNFKGASIADVSLKEMRKLGDVSDEKAKAWLDEMKRSFPDVRKGDALLGIQRPDGSVSFFFNGKLIGEVRDSEFSRLFFGIWLSPQSSEPKMRSELLGLSKGDRP
jgi:hypothetical protein